MGLYSETSVVNWRRGVFVVPAAVGVLALGLGVFTWVRLQPWLAPPNATAQGIAERWDAVLQLQAAPASREGDALLLEALALHAKAPKRECCKKLAEGINLGPPNPRELYVALAREAVCEDQFLDVSAGFSLKARPKENGQKWPPLLLVSHARERQLHQHVMGSVLAPPLRAPSALMDHLEQISRELPPTVLPINIRRVIEAAALQSRKLEAHLKSL